MDEAVFACVALTGQWVDTLLFFFKTFDRRKEVENVKKTKSMNMQIRQKYKRRNLPMCLEYLSAEIFENFCLIRRQTFCGSHIILHLIFISLVENVFARQDIYSH